MSAAEFTEIWCQTERQHARGLRWGQSMTQDHFDRIANFINA